MYYGLIRRSTALAVPIRSRIGDDWHFVATLAYLGRIKALDCVGYNKKLGGTSRTFRHYAKLIGVSKFAGNFPHLAMACDAFAEIAHRSPVYGEMKIHSKLILALVAFWAILTNYYLKSFPLVVAGRMRRMVMRLIRKVFHAPAKKVSYRVEKKESPAQGCQSAA